MGSVIAEPVSVVSPWGAESLSSPPSARGQAPAGNDVLEFRSFEGNAMFYCVFRKFCRATANYVILGSDFIKE